MSTQPTVVFATFGIHQILQGVQVSAGPSFDGLVDGLKGSKDDPIYVTFDLTGPVKTGETVYITQRMMIGTFITSVAREDGTGHNFIVTAAAQTCNGARVEAPVQLYYNTHTRKGAVLPLK